MIHHIRDLWCFVLKKINIEFRKISQEVEVFKMLASNFVKSCKLVSPMSYLQTCARRGVYWGHNTLEEQVCSSYNCHLLNHALALRALHSSGPLIDTLYNLRIYYIT